MQYDMNGNKIDNKQIETDRKFWSVPVTIVSTVWEEGYHIYEANSEDEALEMYDSEKETPIDIEYCGQIEQEYKYDEADGDMPEQLNNNSYEVQNILLLEQKHKEWLAERGIKDEHQ